MSMSFETLALDAGSALVARLHGTLRLNLVDRDILERATQELAAALENPEIRCVLLSGVDEQAFVGGANLRALGSLDADTAEGFIRAIHDFCALLRHAAVPVVAVLRGHCLGAGLEIAAACDIRIADRSAVCGMPEVRVGVPSVVEAALLPGLIGWGRTRELLLRGHLIGADEAQAIGLVQHVTDAAELDALALTIANDIAAGAPGALAAQKRLMLRWEEVGMAAAIEAGVTAFVEAYSTGDEPRRYTDKFFARGRKPR